MVASFAPANGFPVNGIFQMYFSGLETMGQAYDPFFKGLARAQLEAMGFMNRRAQAYFEIPTRLSQCRTPQDLASEQMRFWRAAYEDYAHSVARVTEAMSAGVPSFGSAAPNAESAHDYITFPEPTGVKPHARSGRGKEQRAA
jgi:phasin protein